MPFFQRFSQKAGFLHAMAKSLESVSLSSLHVMVSLSSTVMEKVRSFTSRMSSTTKPKATSVTLPVFGYTRDLGRGGGRKKNLCLSQVHLLVLLGSVKNYSHLVVVGNIQMCLVQRRRRQSEAELHAKHQQKFHF